MGRNDGFIDFQLRLNRQAWAVLHALDGEPSFAPWDEARHAYKIDCETAAFYNGRERGFSLKVAHGDRFPRGEFLYVCFAENRSSDDIVVYTWRGPHHVNPPGPADLPADAWERARWCKSVEEAVSHIRGLIALFLKEEDAVASVESVLSS